MSNVELKDLGSLSIEELREALVRNGVEWAKDVPAKADLPNRTETKRQWMVENREATDEEIDLFVEMPFILGSSITPVEPRELTQNEIDDVVNEITSINKSKDIIEGRVARIRQTVFDSLTFMAANDNLDDPEFQPGALISEKHGIKLSREISGGKAFVDMDLAREVFGDRFDRIVNRIETVKVVTGPDGNPISEETNVEFEINETALETQVTLGNISLDELQKVTKIGKRTPRFTTRKI